MDKIKKVIKSLLRDIVRSKYAGKIPYIRKTLEKRDQRSLEGKRMKMKVYGQSCLEVIKEQLQKEGIVYWIDYGTLLGAIRENDFIEHDFDIDIGVKYDNNNEKIEKAFKNIGILKLKEFILDGVVVEQTYEYNGLTFDIFYYFYNDNHMWTYTFYPVEGVSKKKKYSDKIVTTDLKVLKCFVKKRGIDKLLFKGGEYPIPENPIGYLEENYGKNFMTPIKEWDYIEDPKNTEEVASNDTIMIDYTVLFR